MATFTLTGRVLGPDAEPIPARVIVTPTTAVVDGASDTVYFGPAVVKTDELGEFSVVLLDAVDTVPTSFGYVIRIVPTYRVSGVSFTPVEFTAPGVGGILDLSDLVSEPTVVPTGSALTTASGDAYIAGRLEDPLSLTRAAADLLYAEAADVTNLQDQIDALPDTADVDAKYDTPAAGGYVVVVQFSTDVDDPRISADTTSTSVLWVTTYSGAPTYAVGTDRQEIVA